MKLKKEKIEIIENKANDISNLLEHIAKFKKLKEGLETYLNDPSHISYTLKLFGRYDLTENALPLSAYFKGEHYISLHKQIKKIVTEWVDILNEEISIKVEQINEIIALEDIEEKPKENIVASKSYNTRKIEL